MKSSSSTLLLSAGAATTALALPQASSGCCFHLDSVGTMNETVEEDHGGHLVLGGSFQRGGFCLDMTSQTIEDSLGHNCFMRSPNYQFECYAGAVGSSVFDIVPSADGKTKLAYDNGPGTFLACPTTSVEQSYGIYSTIKTDKTACMQVALVLADQTSECAASNGTSSTASYMVPSTTQVALPVTNTSTAMSTAKASGYAYGSGCGALSVVTAKPTQTPYQATTPPFAVPVTSNTCDVSPAAPSIGPSKLGYPEASAPDGVHDTTANASITPTNSTLFEYSIPQSFVTNSSQLCALQFRLPYCSTLPKGYPCFHFSGSEQERSSDSGMIFSSVEDSGGLIWDNTALHQVYPGDTTVIGTFKCGRNVTAYGARKMSWIASSVRNFALEFMQAGVGSEAEFMDGVGAWIVPCS
ncbi:hypothetical protein BJ170DRAFT_196154 [Xylariales sp. AK1849]|nr:hypothetical protein BJ170DRAFT_196154 [Xylariales sp. AK1849]